MTENMNKLHLAPNTSAELKKITGMSMYWVDKDKLGNIINVMNDKEKIQMISVSASVLDLIHNPTDKMKQPHAMKWKL